MERVVGQQVLLSPCIRGRLNCGHFQKLIAVYIPTTFTIHTSVHVYLAQTCLFGLGARRADGADTCRKFLEFMMIGALPPKSRSRSLNYS